MSKNIVANFTVDELKKLIDDQTSCVSLHKSVYNLQLYPYHLSDIGSSIKELLNAKVAKYDNNLDGILLGYKNLKLITPQGSIVCDSCFIHIEVECNFYTFQPKIDSLITGIVNKKSDNHVGCLVHRLFNVSVPNTDEEDWAGHEVNIGDEVLLKIVYLDLEARLPYIRSQLVETRKKVKKVKKGTEEDSPKKKKKKIKTEPIDNFSEESDNKEEESPSLKKKKKKIPKDDSGYNIQTELDLNFSKNKIKKKSKLNNLTDSTINNNNTSEKKEKLKSAEIVNKLNSSKTEFNNSKDNSINKDSKLEKEKKRKSTEIKIKLNGSKTEELNNSKIKKEFNNNKAKKVKTNENAIDEEIKSLQDSELVNFDKSPKSKKKRKSEGQNTQIDSTINLNLHANTTFMADAEELNSSKIKKELNNSKTKKVKINKNTIDEELKSLQDSEIIKQIVNFDKSPKSKKKRKSEEQNTQIDSTIKLNLHANSTFMADAEDRKTKKRKSSINIMWENKELDLYDSDLEKTLGESSKTRTDDLDKFNLCKISALNENEQITEKEVTKDKKRKNKNSEDEPKPKKKKQEVTKEELKKKSKTKKVKN